jgi:phage tail-like protein
MTGYFAGYNNKNKGERKMRASHLLQITLAVFLAFVVAGCDNETSDPIIDDGDDSAGISLAALAAGALVNGNGPHGNYRFLVVIDGVEVASFSEARVLEAEVEVIEYRNGNEISPFTPHKIPGLAKFGDLVLKRGVTDNTELFDWFRMVLDGMVERRNISIALLDNSGDKVVTWNFSKAWPSKYKGPDMDALGNEIAIEELVIVHEGMQMMDPI